MEPATPTAQPKGSLVVLPLQDSALHGDTFILVNINEGIHLCVERALARGTERIVSAVSEWIAPVSQCRDHLKNALNRLDCFGGAVRNDLPLTGTNCTFFGASLCTDGCLFASGFASRVQGVVNERSNDISEYEAQNRDDRVYE